MANEKNHYYKEACEVWVPITLKVPICVEPEVIAKRPVCSKENGHKPYKPEPVGIEG